MLLRETIDAEGHCAQAGLLRLLEILGDQVKPFEIMLT